MATPLLFTDVTAPSNICTLLLLIHVTDLVKVLLLIMPITSVINKFMVTDAAYVFLTENLRLTRITTCRPGLLKSGTVIDKPTDSAQYLCNAVFTALLGTIQA